MSEYMINIAVCDDNPHYVSSLIKLIEKNQFQYNIEFKVSSYTDPIELINNVASEKIDLLFLDIEMPEMDGFQVASNLLTSSPNTRIVFLTSHREFIQRAFKVRAYRYLFKPVSDDDISEVIKDATDELLNVEGIVLTSKKFEQYIQFSEIYFIESIGEQTAVHMREEHIISGKTLKQWVSINVPELYQCHKSYIVNFLHISKIEKGFITLDNGVTVPLSVRNYSPVKKAYHEYIKDHAKFI